MVDPPDTNAAPPLRRIAAGDWVVARNAAAEVSPGLGKLTGGDYEGHVLIRGRVELPSGTRSAPAGDLARVLPEHEAELLRRALEAELVPQSDRAQLQEALERYRAGELKFVRTPGLLDALWATHRRADPERPGLAALFESGWDALPEPLLTPATTTLEPTRRWVVPSVEEEPGDLAQHRGEGAAERVERARAYARAGDWWSLQRLVGLDHGVAREVLYWELDDDDLQLAARFGYRPAAAAAGVPPSTPPRPLRASIQPLAAFWLKPPTQDASWQPALAYHCAALAGLADAWRALSPEHFESAHEVRPALRAVGSWLAEDPSFQTSLRTLGHAQAAVWQAKLLEETHGTGPAHLSLAVGALAYACAPLVSSCGLPGAPDPEQTPGRMARVLFARERLLAAACGHALARLTAAGVHGANSEAFAGAYDAVLVRVEQRANRALVRWLISRSLFVG